MESVVEVLSSYSENSKWISHNYARLEKKYHNKWIAVLNKTVIDSDPDLNRLTERLRKKHAQTFSQIATEYITTKRTEQAL
jgi:hypothetical protein